ncbi:MAG TPA: TMEM175 family protein [Acidimicrobiales bacterium]|nr:TMEM175 family protein [Acidimicrobiales bacterium]
MSAGRMEAFSDGVMAILITIMVLQLHQPHGTSFADLRSSFPSLLAYVLSFVNIAIYWNNHHHLLKAIPEVTGAMLWANLNLLFWLSLFPFATSWMSEGGFVSTPVAVYGVVLAMAAIAYTILQTVIVAADGPNSRLRRVLGRDLKGKLSLASYLVTIPLAFVWRWGSIAIFVAVSIAWLIPDRRVEYYIKSLAGKRSRFS